MLEKLFRNNIHIMTIDWSMGHVQLKMFEFEML